MKLFYVQRPVAVIMITIGLILFGIISLFQLPQTLLPDLNEPSLTVEATYRDAGPKEIERILTKPIEDALGTLSGLQRMESFSQPSQAIVRLRFRWGQDIPHTMQQIREALDRLSLPPEVLRPKVLRFDPSFEPVARVAFQSTEHPLWKVRSLLEENIKPVLETIPGIATTLIKGGQEDEIAILFARGKLEELKLSPADIVASLKNENVTLPSGKFDRGEKEYFVRVEASFTGIDDIRQLIIKEVDGRSIRLEDVAEIQPRLMEAETITRVDRKPAIFLDVYKEADANVIGVVDELRLAIDRRLPGLKWMKGIEATIVSDASNFIRSSLQNVVSAALLGGLLAMTVLYLFLGSFVPSLLIGFTIPIVLPVTFFLMKQHGITLNIVSLGGLALGLGMLVDNSIVVLENIEKKFTETKDAVLSASQGTREMLSPVLASTLTTICVFAPLGLVEGLAGQLFSDLAWTIVYSLSGSFLVAVIVLPTLYVLVEGGRQYILRWQEVSSEQTRPTWAGLALAAPTFRKIKAPVSTLRHPGQRLRGGTKLALFGPWLFVKLIIHSLGDLLRIALATLWAVILFSNRIIRFVLAFALRPLKRGLASFRRLTERMEQDSYPTLLGRLIAHRRLVALSLTGLSVIAGALGWNLGGDLLPPLSNSRFMIDGAVSLGSDIRTTDSTSFAVESILRSTPGTRNVVSLVGIDQAQAMVGNAGLHKFSVQFDTDPDIFKLEELRARLVELEGVEWSLRQPSVTVQTQPIEVIVATHDLQELRESALEVKKIVDDLDFLVPTSSTLSDGLPEITVRIDSSRLLPLGVDTSHVVSSVSQYLQGTPASELEEGQRSTPITVRLREADIRNADDLAAMKILTKDHASVDLGSVATIENSLGPSYIYHTSGIRAVRFGYQIKGKSLKEAHAAIQRVLPPGSPTLDIRVEGQTEEYQRSTQSLLLAIALAVFMVYLVMASQFESFTQPLLIMGSIPLAFIGVILWIFPFGISVNVMVLVGGIVLVGIIVNNAIIFISSVNDLQQRGSTREQAVRATAQRRLRPILMTTATTVLGLIPMALSSGDGASLSKSIAITVIGGLTFGTILTLVVIPILLISLGPRAARV